MDRGELINQTRKLFLLLVHLLFVKSKNAKKKKTIAINVL